MKVVIDTNVLIAAVWDDNSYAAQIIDEVIKGYITAYASEKTLKENQFILKQAIPNPVWRKKLEHYFNQLVIVKPRQHFRVVKWDPEDDKFIDAAWAARADYLITSDSHLLDEVGEFRSIKIVSPKDFWLTYQSQKRDDQEEWRSWIKNILQ